jgi:hypothetical protein
MTPVSFSNSQRLESPIRAPAAVIAVAKDVHDLVDTGTPDTDIVKNLQLHNPSFTGHGVAEFTMIAAGEYCPKYLTGDGRPPKPPGAVGN